MEVMKVREYPVSDFEQRAADISVSYSELVTNYRADEKLPPRMSTKNYGRLSYITGYETCLMKNSRFRKG